MKETVASEFASARLDLPAGARDAARAGGGLAGRSQLVWGEHCTECAFPRCYASCDLYDPRPDLNCRRFAHGIEAVRGPGGEDLIRIRFRRWGKLEAKGPAPMRSAQAAGRLERRDALLSGALAAAPLPLAVKQSLTWRWNRRKTAARVDPVLTPDAFVAEGWSVDGRPRHFTLTFLQGRHGDAMVQTSFELGAAWSRTEIPVAEVAARIDLAADYLVQIEPVGEAEGVDVAFGLVDFVAYESRPAVATAAPEAPAAPLVKVLVWDLDDTLWRGTLAEDGVEGVVLRSEAVAALKALDQRGVLHSIASKNDAATALEALARFGLLDYFLHPQVNWGPKSQSIAAIAAALDLGVDAFAFVDDQPFERAEAQSGHPKLRVLDAAEVAGLEAHAWFDHPATPEAAKRRGLYQAEAQRKSIEGAAGGDYLGFLRGCDLRLTMAPLGRDDAERAFELSQRTNQLNFTGAKFTREQVSAMLAPDPRRLRLTLRCADRFGDYGLIGFADLDLEAGEISDFFMSCRVQRKRVEHAAFQRFAELLKARGQARMDVRFRATERNGAAVEMLKGLGFQEGSPGADGLVRWTRSLAEPFEDAGIVAIAAPIAEAA